MKSALTSKLTMALLTLGLSTTPVPLIFAGVSLNTIDPVAVVTDDGRHLVVTGPIACTAGERVTVQVMVTQRMTGAMVQGRTRFTCTGDMQQWEVRAQKVGKAELSEGAATAVALARSRAEGASTDAHQWLVDVTVSK